MIEQKGSFWNEILNWSQEHGRDFPWRRTNNAFHVLIAEFLLQQTNVRKVEEVYQEILETYPTPGQLADADISELERIIAPIGLIYRAARLKKAAGIIYHEHSGKVPDNEKELKQLPGVGDYIVNAVLCYGLGKPMVPIDTNVIRLFSRYFGYQSAKKRPHTDRELAVKIRKHYRRFSDTRAANLAVLDFAAHICTARNPKHETCPIRHTCFYYNEEVKAKSFY
ncbi:HhH-GPD family protein [Aneurinibacillus migulanus]|uniref:Adenine DNA glycosylase n=1 Tax=Aneurinibacillus migulanus TaxID=47500 RepID=A0A0D1XKV4_ANEMI|nr:hypothetical protein [Aneurinibacillus migulanus]KIV52898.1 hypothetical protein TS65_22630 [Aneurinibacillus migulanus]KON95175.1 hypothetical protein AF333_06470 [Aneurinibacillus migulanus]MED0890910.1 hypothetical protein [Aneurinibacillus migulanus]MED1616602.1 hypothetical protein [Aneurinibacillus migulanus]SDI82350.1 A/G-specific DNA-adenine glycosylase [Aneurinibacillus migulanus]